MKRSCLSLEEKEGGRWFILEMPLEIMSLILGELSLKETQKLCQAILMDEKKLIHQLDSLAILLGSRWKDLVWSDSSLVTFSETLWCECCISHQANQSYGGLTQETLDLCLECDCSMLYGDCKKPDWKWIGVDKMTRLFNTGPRKCSIPALARRNKIRIRRTPDQKEFHSQCSARGVHRCLHTPIDELYLLVDVLSCLNLAK